MGNVDVISIEWTNQVVTRLEGWPAATESYHLIVVAHGNHRVTTRDTKPFLQEFASIWTVWLDETFVVIIIDHIKINF